MTKTIAFLAAMAALVLLASCGYEQTDNSKSVSTEGNMNSRTIVVYFSCSGNTANTARLIAEMTGGGLCEIVPETPYSDKDLDWRNHDSRSSREHADTKSRPALAGTLPDYSHYDTIYLGYPIWGGEAPRIVLSFLEAAAKGLKGKTIIPFCTSHSSPIGDSDRTLHAFAPDATWLPGKRFRLTPPRDEVATWLKSLIKD